MSKGRGRRRRGRRTRGFAFNRVQSRALEEESGDEVAADVNADLAAPLPELPIQATQLTAEQRTAADRALRGESLFLTGAAGTGKSFLLRYLVQELERLQPTGVAVTAPTGIAASNIGGQTIHSFAGVGLGVGSMRTLLGRVKKSAQAVQRWKNARVLVVDEISMLDADLFDALGSIASAVRGSREPFGGLQLLVCGDFLQLPPVQGRGEGMKRFAFQGDCWRRCGLDCGTVVLREAVRQAKDPFFVQILNEVRVGIISLRAEELLDACHVSVKPPPDDNIIPTKLYCLNKNVDAENAARLARLPGTAVAIRAKDRFKGRDRQRRAALASLLDKKVPAELKLKAGAQVILLKNQPTLGLVNGSRGIVEGFEDGRPLVRFDTGQRVHVGKERFEQGGTSASAIRIQVPLKLGWALTVHKAQGMTLSRAELQIDDAFESGQAYVALSRLTDLAGLWLRGGQLSSSNVIAHPDVLEFYESATLPGGAGSTGCSGVAPRGAYDVAFVEASNWQQLQKSPMSELEVHRFPTISPLLKGTPKEVPSTHQCQERGRGAPFSVPLKQRKRPLLAVDAKSAKLRCSERSCRSSSEVSPSLDVASCGAAAGASLDPHQGWVSPPKTWGGGVIELD